MKRLQVLSALLALGMASGAALAQAPNDVPKDHWAYSAVEDLSTKGLIKGYPPEGNFFGKRTVTRYEMATVIQRVLARFDELLTRKADKGETPAQAGVTPEQLDEVRRLVNDFRTELTVIGTDMAKIKDELIELRAQIGDIKSAADRAAADAAAARQAAEDNRQGIQSSLDAIKEQRGRIDKLESTKVDSGFGSIKINGLMQLWAVGEMNAPSRGQTDTFRIRRAEIKLSGKTTPRSYWWAMIDPAKTMSLNTTSSGGNVTGVTLNNASQILQEAVAGFTLAPEFAVELGQQKVPMSMEGIRSASQLLTVERSIFNTLPTGNGRVGDIRDLGVMLRYANRGLAANAPKSTIEAQVAAFNDAGARQNNTDDNNAKEIMYHVQYKGIPHLTLGAYQEITTGVNGVLLTPRTRFGVEGAFTLGRHTLEAEFVRARDAVVASGAVTNPALLSEGGYLTYAYTLNPTWQFVLRGETWNPNRDGHGATYAREYDLTLGANYYLTGHNSKIQLNWVRKNIVGAAPGYLGLDRNLFLMNFQQAF